MSGLNPGDPFEEDQGRSLMIHVAKNCRGTVPGMKTLLGRAHSVYAG